jgi:hypothetical protein
MGVCSSKHGVHSAWIGRSYKRSVVSDTEANFEP